MNNPEKNPVPGSCDWVPEEGREEKKGTCCDWSPSTEEKGNNCSVFYPFRAEFTWEGVPQERYKSAEGGWAAIARNVLVGARGESALFDLRYFEIAPGGYSSLEKHNHEHVVICVRGRGRVLLDGQVREMNFLDTVYIAPGDPHQLRNPFSEPFGFFCIVNHDRDRPIELAEEELALLLAGESGGEIRR
jgi:quercetin dioxygenase-like cupin family protein